MPEIKTKVKRTDCMTSLIKENKELKADNERLSYKVSYLELENKEIKSIFRRLCNIDANDNANEFMKEAIKILSQASSKY